MALLRVKNLRFTGLHGHLPEEKIVGNTFEIDVEASIRLPEADSLALVPDYSKIAKIVQSVVHGPSVDLIESLNRLIFEGLRSAFPEVPAWRIAVRKLNPPMNPSCDYTEIDVTWPVS